MRTCPELGWLANSVGRCLPPRAGQAAPRSPTAFRCSGLGVHWAFHAFRLNGDDSPCPLQGLLVVAGGRSFLGATWGLPAERLALLEALESLAALLFLLLR